MPDPDNYCRHCDGHGCWQCGDTGSKWQVYGIPAQPDTVQARPDDIDRADDAIAAQPTYRQREAAEHAHEWDFDGAKDDTDLEDWRAWRIDDLRRLMKENPAAADYYMMQMEALEDET